MGDDVHKLLSELNEVDKKYDRLKAKLDEVVRLRDAYRLILKSKNVDYENPPQMPNASEAEAAWPVLRDAMLNVIAAHPSGIHHRQIFDLVLQAGINPGAEQSFRNKVYRLKPRIEIIKRGIVRLVPKQATDEDEEKFQAHLANKQSEEDELEAKIQDYMAARDAEDEEKIQAYLIDKDDAFEAQVRAYEDEKEAEGNRLQALIRAHEEDETFEVPDPTDFPSFDEFRSSKADDDNDDTGDVPF